MSYPDEFDHRSPIVGPGLAIGGALLTATLILSGGCGPAAEPAPPADTAAADVSTDGAQSDGAQSDGAQSGGADDQGVEEESGSEDAGDMFSDAAPGPIETGNAFGFDDVASYDTGLAVELLGRPLARRASDQERGAEATNGELIVFAVLITNDSAEELDARDTTITVQYAGVESAPVIIDEAEELQTGFAGTIAVGAEETLTIGFAVPRSAAGALAITIAPGNGVNEPVTFVGSAEFEDA